MIIDQPPTKEDIVFSEQIQGNIKTSRPWEYWFNSVFRSITSMQFLNNSPCVLNPDYNWSRVKGNTPTTTDGEFVEKWNVASGGMTFVITPTDYTSTVNNALTGSDRYVNINISVPNANGFTIYQDVPKILSMMQNRQIAISGSFFNHNPTTIQGLFGLAFDVNGDGIFEHDVPGKVFQLASGYTNLFVRIPTPKISNYTTSNKVRSYFKLLNLTSPINLDSYYIKPEISDDPTPIRINHILEKVLIDNS